MSAILKREFSSYFSSAIAYVVLAVFYFFSGMFLFWYCLLSDSANLTPVFINMFMVILFLIPILTMKLFSEEKRQKTDQALLTAPVSLLQVVMGKFFSAVLVYACCLAVFFVYAVILSCFTTPAWSLILCNFIGVFLMGCALIAIDMFISSLTESQIVAAVAGFAAGLAIYMIDSIASMIPVDFIKTILNSLSFLTHLQNFSAGLFTISDAVFFFSVIVIFVFLTIRVFEKKRWS